MKSYRWLHYELNFSAVELISFSKFLSNTYNNLWGVYCFFILHKLIEDGEFLRIHIPMRKNNSKPGDKLINRKLNIQKHYQLASSHWADKSFRIFAVYVKKGRAPHSSAILNEKYPHLIYPFLHKIEKACRGVYISIRRN